MLPQRFRCLDRFTLKMIALVSMTMDHAASALASGTTATVMHALGRIAFPIYCFLLVEGYFHTRDVKRYAFRLLCVYLLSEIPFDLALFLQFPYQNRTNVMMTLLLGLLAVTVLDGGIKGFEEHLKGPGLSAALLLFSIVVTAMFIHLGFLLKTDYRGGGVVLILLFYLLRSHPLFLAAALPPLLHHYYNPMEMWALLALVPICLYSHEQGAQPLGRLDRWFFYLYYPLHLMILVLLRTHFLGVSVEVLGYIIP